MRIVVWNCNMAFHRKFDALRRFEPDIAIVCECADPDRLRARGAPDWGREDPIWVGDNPDKGLAVFTFNGYRARLAEPHIPALRHIAPLHVTGPGECNLLAVWAQNASGGVTRKHQAGPLRRALTTYKVFLSDRPAVIAGDLNNNAIWDRPGWRINHMSLVAALEKRGLVSAYHEVCGEAHGQESAPTLYWRDRTKDGPTYHIDYVFLPKTWIGRVRDLTVGSYEDWCGAGLSDHVPILVDLDV